MAGFHSTRLNALAAPHHNPYSQRFQSHAKKQEHLLDLSGFFFKITLVKLSLISKFSLTSTGFFSIIFQLNSETILHLLKQQTNSAVLLDKERSGKLTLFKQGRPTKQHDWSKNFTLRNP